MCIPFTRQSIYPLIVFILVALDKVHYTRGPRVLLDEESSVDSNAAVTVTFDLDIERPSMMREAKVLGAER